jgi:signal transduction histidine kinase
VKPDVRRAVRRYGGTVVVSAAALWTSITLAPLIGSTPFVVFYLAVILSAFCWGLGPALATAALGVTSIDYFVLSPTLSLKIESASDAAELLSFGVVAFTTSALTQRLRAAHRRMEEDAAELSQANEHLRRATAEAESANAAKSQFLATMSHEIRTPINGVLGFAELLELGISGSLTPRQREYVQRIMTSSRHLSGLVSDVLDLGKIEAGRIAIAHRPGHLGTAARHAVALVRPLAEAREIELLMQDCGVGSDTRYSGDPQRVEQILVNLLSNAVKFTSVGGRVTVTCPTVDAPTAAPGVPLLGTGRWTCVRVEDTGCGIAPDQLERIFDSFVQGRTALSERAPGSGLGLAISRQLARLMGGELTVESAINVGSTFTLWLPALA